MDALKEFPKTEQKLFTKKGTAVCQKIDIFQGHLWYAYEGEWMNWHKLTTTHANDIIAANKAKKPVESLEEFASELVEEPKIDFGNVVGQDSLTRFDKPKQSGNKKRNNRNRNKKRANPNSNQKTKEQSKGKHPNNRNKNRKKPKAKPSDNS